MRTASPAPWLLAAFCAACGGPAANVAVADRAAPSAPPMDAHTSPVSGNATPDAAAPTNAKAAPPLVGAPVASEAEVPEGTRPRMGSVGPFTYIYAHPAMEGLALGSIRMGTSVPLRSDTPIPGKGCGRGFYAVAPRGYVCLDPTTTLDLDDPYYVALRSLAPTGDSVWYYRYAFSNGAPMYSRVPTREETEKEDLRFGPRGSYRQLAEWSKGHEELLMTEPIAPTDPVPDVFAGGTRHVGGGFRSVDRLLWRVIPNGSMVAFAKAFEYEGRTWLVTPDLMLVPADRVRQLRRSTFHGVKLGDGVELPLAWNRTKLPKPKYRKQPGGALVAVPDALAAKTWVPIVDETTVVGDKKLFAVRGEPDTFVEAADVTVSRARTSLPKGVEPGRKWIEAKILPGTLTAYEGDRPVLATLFSPGKGGVPVPGLDNTKYATTSLGIFPIEWKDHVATMSSEKHEPKVNWFTDVPFIQYLRAPLAMHVAYWHEDFGNPKSAECVNVSPEDGRFLFGWTEPALPEGWGAIRPGSGNGPSTPVVITAQ